LHRYMQQYIDVIGEPLAGDLFKMGNTIRTGAPCFTRDPGDDIAGIRIFLYQFKIVVVLLRPEGMIRYIRNHPESNSAEGIVNDSVDPAIQF
jgi:hypothetical protein